MSSSSHPPSLPGAPTEHSSVQPAPALESVLSALATGVTSCDLAGRVRYANAAALSILGVRANELVGRTLSDAGFACHDREGVALDPIDPARAASRAGAAGEVLHTVARFVRAPAFDAWLECRTTPLCSHTGAHLGSVMSFVDVTERVRQEANERSMSEHTERMRDVLRLMAAGVLFVDKDGRIEYANRAAAALSGLTPDQVIGQLAADPAWHLTDATGAVLPYEALPVPTALRERRDVRGVELGIPTLSGTTRWMRVSAFPMLEPSGELRGAVVTTEDVTEQHTLAEQLLQAQKIEGMGQLAGGIAHDFNNLLTVIVGNASLALATMPRDSAQAKAVAEILDAANHGASLTRQMLTFARKQVLQPRPVQLDRLVRALEALLRRALGEDITLRWAFESELWPVRIDPGQMEQVIVNMTINARDAMPRGGTLLVETRNTTLDEQQVQAHPGVEPGDFVMVSVTDTGTGMSRELVPRIFEPFFTTKPLGTGTGLGLSICHGVVKQARGFIGVDTELGRGTSFRIYLPRAGDAEPEATARRQEPEAHGHGTILLVEDQEPVRKLVARTLSGYGYDVISAASSKQALALHARLTRPIDLLLTDVVMPETGGLELAEVLQARVPGLPVLYMTGYVDTHSAAAMGLIPDANLLLKPFTPMQLRERVQQLLSRTKNGSSTPR